MIMALSSVRTPDAVKKGHLLICDFLPVMARVVGIDRGIVYIDEVEYGCASTPHGGEFQLDST